MKRTMLWLLFVGCLGLSGCQDKSPQVITEDADADAIAAYERENAEAAEALNDEYSEAAKKE